MLDHNEIVKNIDKYIERLSNRGGNFNYLRDMVEFSKKRNKLIFLNDNLKKQRNNISKNIGTLVKEDWKNPEILISKEKIKHIKSEINNNEKEIIDLNAQMIELLLETPNLPYEECPIGKNEKNNVEIKKWGTINKKTNKSHWEITTEKNMVDYIKTSENSGTRFVTYLNNGAILKRALMNFMLDNHNKNNYQEMSLPVLVKQESMYGTGQFPKFIDDAYICKNNMVLIPTSEVSLTNFHKNEIIPIDKLPKYYTSFSECFRKEAGAAGKDTRGIIRLHQFSKVELVKIVEPKNSYEELEKLLKDAENILQKLNLPYRVIELCTGDLGFSASKTYDIEVWMPSRGKYMEISSCSNCSDYQARRINIKYKKGTKNRFVHTLNGSGLAIDRLIAALIENNYDEKTKKIKIPSLLQRYVFNKKEI